MTHIATKLTAARSVTVGDQEVPGAIPKGFVRLRLAAASICGTDLHYYAHFANAGFELQNPVTLGHEACARVVDPNGSELKEGQLVALNPIMNCGQCDACRRGEENLCRNKNFPGSATTVPHLDGFFREIIDHPLRCCRPVAEEVNPCHLTFAEPMACALHALNKAKVAAGHDILVMGCGPMGLLTAAGAAARGARVSAADLRPEAVDVAVRAGAAEGLVIGKISDDDLKNRFDVVIEASGAIPAFNTALEAVKQKGRVAILSNIQLTEAQVMLRLIMLKEIEIVGSFQFNKEFEEAIQLIEAGTVDFDTLTAARFPLKNTAHALRTVAEGKALGKIVLLGPDEH
ncbi:MAG: alcohol dehydrogenase catalytic domain-containing protein [Ectothiorhodospiraceae bacterium AqS1]|nr:alcohol dehydrogenase catalytic domain-containing protein [Ectothiorhodospiraceae bacterium AqS1]